MRTKAYKPNKINVVTLGCSKNVVDSEVLLGHLKADEIEASHNSEKDDADIVVVNTCGFIDNAKQESIDTILITHMHPDHTGGLLDSSGAILFPNAELVISQVEWEFWHDDAILASVPEGSRGFFHMARSAVAPYKDRLRLISGEAEAVPGVSAVPLPGHTLGHTGFMLDGGREGLLIWGDLVHMTALQFANPDMTIAFDADPAQTAASRRQMMDRAAADNLLVTGMHLDFPGLGQVKRQGDAYRYQSAPWQFGL